MSSNEMPYGDIEIYERPVDSFVAEYSLDGFGPLGIDTDVDERLLLDKAMAAVEMASAFVRPLSVWVHFEKTIVDVRIAGAGSREARANLETVTVEKVDAHSIREVITSRCWPAGHSQASQGADRWSSIRFKLADTLLGPASDHTSLTVHNYLAGEWPIDLVQQDNQTWIRRSQYDGAGEVLYFVITQSEFEGPHLDVSVAANWSLHGHENGAQVQQIKNFGVELEQLGWNVTEDRLHSNDQPFYHFYRDRKN